LGELERSRATPRWYPHDLWLYLLAAQWRCIEQGEAFVGRTGAIVGDDLGSRVVAARLVRELMRLCFLMEQQYARTPSGLGRESSCALPGPRTRGKSASTSHAT
jgi:Domain of unknown function (DUF4037)